MLKDMVRSCMETSVSYELVFDTENNGGYSFPCDEKGNVYPLEHEVGRKNLKWCLEHPEKFVKWNRVETIKSEYKVPAHGKCECGNEVYLVDEYYGACQCECGRWYNLFGQELKDPMYWDMEEDW